MLRYFAKRTESRNRTVPRRSARRCRPRRCRLGTPGGRRQDRGWRFPALARALQLGEGVERPEEVAGDGGVVAKIHLPVFGRHGHEADTDGVVRVQMFGAVLDDLARASALQWRR